MRVRRRTPRLIGSVALLGLMSPWGVLQPMLARAQVVFESAERASATPPAKPDGKPVEPPPGGSPATPPAAGAEQKEGEKKDGAKTDDKKDAADTSIKRPTTPPRVADPREFDVKPDANARLQFNFHGQVWPDLLQWLASVRGKSLDWQELPNDYVHVSNSHPQTLAEIQDLFSRLLFERGYTIIEQGEVLQIVKLDKLDPSLLLRVEDEAGLLDLPAHQIAKITFTLPEDFKADRAAEEVKPLVSSHAKVQALMATNRLLVVDIVSNLRDVSALINQEHASAVGKVVPKEFAIRYARADNVADQVMILLGLDPSTRRTPMELQVEQQRLQLFQQMQQQGKDITKFLRSGEAPTVYLAVNHRNNSVVVNAPPKEMGVIERAIEMFDVPDGMLAGHTVAPLTMERYQLATVKPQSVITALQELGNLDPRTQFKSDTTAKIVFAHATAADHVKIKQMIADLDGTGRQFEVIWLRRLPADAVAASVHSLMVGEEEKQDDRRSRGYYFYSFSEPSEEQEESPTKGFRVDADVENNRLLLWANENELKEVRKLLAKLGELPGDANNPHTVRVLDPRSDAGTRRLLQQIRQMWPSLAPNGLEIDDQSAPREPNDERRQPPTERVPAATESDTDVSLQTQPLSGPSVAMAEVDNGGAASVASTPSSNTARDMADATVAATADRTLGWSAAALLAAAPPVSDVAPDGPTRTPANAPARLAADEAAPRQAAATVAAGSAPDSALPPVKVSVEADGRIVLSSADTKALDQLEDLIATVSGKPKPYQVFYLRYASADFVKENLESFFDQDSPTKNNDEENYWRGWYGFNMSDSKKDTPAGLGKRRKIRFIDDYDTNSILVADASNEQLETVTSLIEVYDRPLPEDSISARRFQKFKLVHARASEVAKTIKEVYRDLLSSKDQVFEKASKEKEQNSQATNYYRIYGGVGGGEDDKSPKKVKASFLGALSVGVDDVSNTLIISAQEEWISSISEMIAFLDRGAEPYRPTVQVVNTRVSPEMLQAALTRVFGADSPQVKKPEPEQPEKPANEAKENQPAEPPAFDPAG